MCGATYQVNQIEFSPYQLKFKHSDEIRNGVLVKVTYSNGLVGYSDCHPWEELGHPPFGEVIKKLREFDETHPFIKRVFDHAFNDRESRLQGEEETALKSHHLIVNVHQLNQPLVEELEARGVSHIKVKVGRNPKNEKALLTTALTDSSLKIRLDFNGLSTKEHYLDYISFLLDRDISIDFCEDPFPYHYESWLEAQEKSGVSIAADWENGHIFREKEFPFVIILKPAIDDYVQFEPYLEGKQFIVTSSLDHPLGQLHAARYASYLDQKFPQNKRVHGLQSHLVYEPNRYSIRLSQNSHTFTFPKGGFIDLLEQEKWVS